MTEELKQRIKTSFMLLLLIAGCAYLGGVVFLVLMLGTSLILWGEWVSMISRGPGAQPVLDYPQQAGEGEGKAPHWLNKVISPSLSNTPAFFLGAAVVLVSVIALPLAGLRISLVVALGGMLLLRAFCREGGADWMMLGLGYILCGMLPIAWMGAVLPAGWMYISILVLLVASSDIGAYAFGKWFGGEKLAPSISPNKTKSGFVGAVALTALLTAVLFLFSSIERDEPYGREQLLAALVLGALFSMLGQGGDLFLSWVKRKFGVKDTGHLLPGHGGVFDRLDSYCLTGPVLACLSWLAMSA